MTTSVQVSAALDGLNGGPKGTAGAGRSSGTPGTPYPSTFRAMMVMSGAGESSPGVLAAT